MLRPHPSPTPPVEAVLVLRRASHAEARPRTFCIFGEHASTTICDGQIVLRGAQRQIAANWQAL